ncbi:hypothetical protein [Pseudoxanthomonas winnipegensis]|uniref:hypothetical protein n=1 Tax=Pseudoxanthomonas winnipegensis TaxID=2480810 RepID=UPI0013EF3336|nr:hypothetical protein [Pseudoxanthomonas winnipegensis]
MSIQCQGLDGDMVLGALKDGYDGEDSGFASPAFENITAFVAVAKSLQFVKFGERD